MTERRKHPTISDVALSLAQRSNPPQSKIALERGMKGEVKITVEVGDTDPRKAADTCSALFSEMCEAWPSLRENGGEK